MKRELPHFCWTRFIGLKRADYHPAMKMYLSDLENLCWWPVDIGNWRIIKMRRCLGFNCQANPNCMTHGIKDHFTNIRGYLYPSCTVYSSSSSNFQKGFETKSFNGLFIGGKPVLPKVVWCARTTRTWMVLFSSADINQCECLRYVWPPCPAELGSVV